MSVAKVTFLLGLAGSGKSYRAKRLVESDGAKIFEGVAAPHSQALLRCLFSSLRRGTYCVVEEIAFCIAENRQAITSSLLAEVPGIEIEWICFENDLESANWNVRHRTNKGSADGHMAINHQYHTRYTYPPGASIEPIVRTKARDA